MIYKDQMALITIMMKKICNRSRFVCMPLSIIVTLILIPLTPGYCQEPDAEVQFDGPYVFWDTDTSVVVFYLCDGEFLKEIFPVSKILRFNGLCADSANEYIVKETPPPIGPDIFSDVRKILAISDIHGEYDHLVDILVKSGVINKSLRWIWGDGHLVIVGDVFDRGAKVTECLWLIYRLESEARNYGGAVHYILGNHEMMVLRGDNRYVNIKYLDGIVKKSKIKHEDLFGPDMELGRWLRVKNTIVRINNIVFVHGGISAFVTDQNLTARLINDNIRNAIDLSSARLAFDDFSRFLIGSKGPLWYRGYHYEMEGKYPMASPEEIDRILGYFDSDAIIVGHSETDSIWSLYNGKVFAIDVPVEVLGALEALLWENGVFYRIDYRGNKKRLD